MAAITASMVKELRETTGAGMMDCKKALAEADGDMTRAVEIIRENGQAKVEKKAGRIAAEGLVTAIVDGDNVGAIVEVNSETDFVAKNQTFQDFVALVAKQALTTTAADLDAFLAEKWNADESKTVQDELASQVAVIGENLKIRRFARVEENNGFVASYIHMGGKIGVLVDIETDVVNDAIKEMGKNVAMQAAALKPVYTSRDEVSPEYIAKETEILTVQAKNDPKNAKKPDNIIEKMIAGRLKKELKEFCLVEQPYVKDTDMTVKQYIDSVAKVVGAPIEITRYVRFETGEGIEKKNEDFAAEVAKAMN